MKKFHLFLMSMMLCIFSACHDELWDKIDDLDGRLTQLEEQCKEMNTNIESLQTIVEALQSNDYITSIVEIKKDGIVIGYSITFANHDAITIYHHKNNLAGALVVDVAQEGGTYYWTVNGEWLEDEDGNKVPVTDENVTPKLKVEDDYWYISLDEGATWIEVCKINEKGDSMFKSVTHDDAYVYFTLANGTVLKVAKSGTGSPAEYIFTVTYDANGGEGKAMPVDTVYYGHDVALRSCGYTKKDSVFVEWNTSADGKGAPFKSGHTLRLDRNLVLYAQWTMLREYVDLGLSVKWATCNVGATKPEEYGDYFAWGETRPKAIYDWSTYKWCNGSKTTLTKYNTKSDYGYVDNKTELEASDDAARVNWGGSWRMPTLAEQNELRTECTWEWTTQNGVYGYKVTSKKAGYTDKSIFLPGTGYRYDSSLSSGVSDGYYWSSSLDTDNPGYAYRLFFYSEYVLWNTESRYYGQSVRPVCP